MRLSPSGEGVERLEAWFSGHAYDRHRHETYAIGVTHAGVQAFGYRGRDHASMPGQVMVLHPDEIHDGHAGSETGFGYRMVYVEPRTILAALGEKRVALPFVPVAVARDQGLAQIVAAAFQSFPEPLEELETTHLVVRLADALLLLEARALIVRGGSLAEASLAAGFADQSHLTRHFRQVFGLPPGRFSRLARA